VKQQLNIFGYRSGICVNYAWFDLYCQAK